VLDAVIISDLHLGSENCQARSLCSFLQSIARAELPTRRLILNGDVFNSIDFRRLKKNHWKVLSLLRKLSDKIEIIWICGNHDGSAEIVSHLLGVQVADEYILRSGGRKILVLHGHAFDAFLDAHPILTWVGDCIYWLLQRIDRTHYFAKLAKRNSKTFLRCSKVVEEKSIRYARGKKCSAVCCGHTHHVGSDVSQDVHYYNSGCWTELPSTYLTVFDGQVEVHAFDHQTIAEEEEAETGGSSAAESAVVLPEEALESYRTGRFSEAVADTADCLD
jgi:UDP-2,3-diacylglucosamine pyrophosphatase LpxH